MSISISISISIFIFIYTCIYIHLSVSMSIEFFLLSLPIKICYDIEIMQLFRPEFVMRYHTPLSSDAMTRFGMNGHKEHNAEIREATRSLLEEVIPKLAQQLEREKKELFAVTAHRPKEIVRRLHCEVCGMYSSGYLWLRRAKITKFVIDAYLLYLF